MPDVLTLYRILARVPLGARVFSLAYARRAPYFRTVRPFVTAVAPHHAEVRIRDRRAVRNHLGTVHAIALCNGLEAAMGMLAEATVPPGMRWLPKGMDVQYLAAARGDVSCRASTAPQDWDAAPDVPVAVRAVLADGTTVARGTIRLWVTRR